MVAIDPVPGQPEGVDDLVSQRLRKLGELRAHGIDPYPATFGRTIANGEASERFDELTDTEVSVAGRMVSRRIMGRASFSHIADVTGRVQGMDEAAFEEAARTAAENCPVSQALKGNVHITVDAHLES